MQRRHDIDALRCLAFALLILYHWCMLYVGGDDWDWHLKSTHLGEWLQLPMLFVNRWRMDLIFLISGLSVNFLLRDIGMRDWGRSPLPRQPQLAPAAATGVRLLDGRADPALRQGVANGLVEPGFGRFLLRYFSHSQPWPAAPSMAGSMDSPGTICGTWRTCGPTPSR
jgi:hypothetical protein